MPPRRDTVRDLLHYEYAKLIADAAIRGRAGTAPASRVGSEYWSFVMATYRRLQKGELVPSSILRENKLLVSGDEGCAYCGCTESLQWEHIVPRAMGGPDTIDNLVRACPPCNQRKGARDPLEWYGENRSHIPRLVMGKLLKILFEAHASAGTLDARTFPEGQRLSTHRLVEVFRTLDSSSG